MKNKWKMQRNLRFKQKKNSGKLICHCGNEMKKDIKIEFDFQSHLTFRYRAGYMIKESRDFLCDKCFSRFRVLGEIKVIDLGKEK